MPVADRIVPKFLAGRYDPMGISSSSRVWVRNGTRLGPGLAVARAFGDFYFSSSGVVAVPEITKLKLSLWDYFVVLASDGVYSVMSSAEVVDAVFTSLNVNKSPTEVAADICAEAKRRWLLTEDGDRDDITCVVVFLETAQPVSPPRRWPSAVAKLRSSPLGSLTPVFGLDHREWRSQHHRAPESWTVRRAEAR